MRITESMRAVRAIESTTNAASRLDKAARAASSGLRVETPSDDPAAYASMLSHDARLARLVARGTTLDHAASDLELSENALAHAGEVVIRARELAMQMSNGDLNANDRASAAAEVRSLRESLIGLANTRGATGYLFGGTRTDVPPVDPSGTFMGNGGALRIEVADGVVDDANASGIEAFTAAGVAGRDPFADLDALATALATNDLPSIRGALTSLDGAHSQIVSARTEAGAKIERFRAASSYLGDAKISIAKARADAVEVDSTQAYSELTLAQAAYERSLQVTQRILALTSINRD